jgi:hypothetical protein
MCKYNCGNDTVAKEYACGSCLIDRNEFLYVVVTKVNKTALYDTIENFNREEAKSFVSSNGNGLGTQKRNRLNLNKKSHDEYLYEGKAPAFEVGEILMVDPDFGRELSGRGRKPTRWDIGTETFPAKSLNKAYKCSVAAINNEQE